MGGKPYYVTSPALQHRRSGRAPAHRRRRLILFLLGVLGLTGIVAASPWLSASQALSFLPVPTRLPSPSPVLARVQQTVVPLQGTYGVYVRDLRYRRSYGINGERVFTAASVNKVLILAALYDRVARGEVNLDRMIPVQAGDMQDYGTGILRYTEPADHSIRELATLMIKKSDNTAAYVLANLIGRSNIQSLANGWGLTHTSVGDNKTTPADTVALFEKIYRSELTPATYSEEMLGLLTGTDFEDRLPQLLPKSVRVAHKIGTEIGVVNDAGIVFAPNGPYVLGVFSDRADLDPAVAAIRQISKLVYDFQVSVP